MSSTQESNLSNLIVTITTIIFAVTSLITLFITVSAWKEEREAVRPYLTFYNSPVVDLNDKLTFSFKFNNVGLHPASNLHSQTIIVDSSLKDKPLHTDQFSLVNYIPQNTTSDLVINIDLKFQLNNLNPHYIIINLKYNDPVLDQAHEQIIYLKWAGIKNGKPQPVFHASIDDKNRIVAYLSKL